MLSAAHILAMDAKNLLDVVDSIRTRYPHIQPITNSSKTSPISSPVASTSNSSSPSRKIIHSQQAKPPSPSEPAKQVCIEANENPYQNSMQEEQYQNLGEVMQQTSPVQPETSQQSLYSNEQQQGIYDNDCVLAGQLSDLDIEKLGNDAPQKPVIPVKPFNFNVVKVKSNFGDKSGQFNELKIIEDELYTNTAADSKSHANGKSAQDSGIKLPEPVPCSIVQENIFKKSQQFFQNKQ